MKLNDQDLMWKEVRADHIEQNQYIDFRRCDYLLPDGTTFGPFYNYSRRDYVVIVARDEEGNYLCVRQYRTGIKEVTTEFPAGGIERTDGKEYGDGSASSEEALDAAKRELTEETGYASDDWTHLITIPSNATMADNYAYVYLAKNCRKVSGQHLDDTEFLNVKVCTPDELEAMISEGKFQQAMHVMAYLMAKEK